MRVGMIGIGGIADVYRKALKEYAQPITAVCDINPARVQEIAAIEQCHGYTDYREMLAKESLDAVFVSIPPGAHRDQVIDVVNSGAAVFVAKPIGLDIQLVERTLAAITKSGVINQVGYMSRYSDMASKARELIGDRKVVMGLGRFMVRMGANHPWWGKRTIGGGQIVEQSTHQFDFLRYIMGEVNEVHAYGHKGAGDDIADFEDSTIVTLHFANGGIGSVVSTSCTEVPEGCGWEFTGRDLYVRMIMDVDLNGVIDGQPVSFKGNETGYIRQVGEFLTAVNTKDQRVVRSSYADAVKTLKVTLAAEQSLQTGRAVRV